MAHDGAPMPGSSGRALTQEMVTMRAKNNRMDLIKNLNLWGNELQDISVLQFMPNLEVLSLSVNRVTSLADLQGCPKLCELYLRKNEISDLSEILHLRHLRQMRVLWLSDNPCAVMPHYRQYVLHHLPGLKKLDSQDVTEEERQHANVADFRGMPTIVPTHNGGGDVDEESDDAEGSAWEQPVQDRRDPPWGLRRGASFGSQSSEVDSRRSHGAGSGPQPLQPPSGQSLHMPQDPMVRRYSSHSDSPPFAQEEAPLGRDWAQAAPEPRTPRRGCGGGAPAESQQPWLHASNGGLAVPGGPASTAHRHSIGGGGRQGPGPEATWQEQSPAVGVSHHSIGNGSIDGSSGHGSGGRGFPRHSSGEGDGPRSRAAWGGPGPAARCDRDNRSEVGNDLAWRVASEPHGRGGSVCEVQRGGGDGGDIGNEGRSMRADNILCAVLALIKELDGQGLELVRRAVDQRGSEL